MILIPTILLGLLAYYVGKQIRKYYLLLLALVSLLSIASILWYQPILEEIVVSGFLGLAFYIIVMIAGAFKRESNISKKLRSVRKEYSIFGFIVLIPHFYVYLISYLDGLLAWEFYGLGAMIIMVPLFITSFNKIKNKMKIQNWFKLQKFAYFAYFLIFVHLLVSGSGDHTFEYVVIFSIYTLIKLQNFVFAEKTMMLFSLRVLFGIFILTFAIVWFSNNPITLFASNPEAETFTLTDGVYTGSSSGYNGLPVQVEVTIENGEIVDINILSYGATAPSRGMDYEAAAIQAANNILKYQSTNVDAIAGATHTTEGIIEAVADAIS
ncbi:MAG: FMN-binding protein [Bacilli bacterium]|nr:FMN-binding protein [Bacilli bacterium]